MTSIYFPRDIFWAETYLSVCASGADRGETGPVGEQTGGGRGAVQEDLELPHVLGGERAGERGSSATFF